MKVEELKIKYVNFFPVLEKDAKGLYGFASVCLGDNERDLITLNSLGVYTVLNNPKRKIRLTMPAKKISSGLKFFFKIDEELEEEIIEAVAEEVKGLYEEK